MEFCVRPKLHIVFLCCFCAEVLYAQQQASQVPGSRSEGASKARTVVQAAPPAEPNPQSVWTEVRADSIKFGFFAAGAALTAFFWSGIRKRRELQLAAADEFYEVYGEAFEIVRVWKGIVAWGVSPGAKGKDDSYQKDRWAAYKRACAAEGKVDAFIARLASQRTLTKKQIDSLARFRQAYQFIREQIRCGESLWTNSEDEPYVAFKKFACDVFAMSRKRVWWFPPPDKSFDAIASITSNCFEGKWQLSHKEYREFITRFYEPRENGNVKPAT